MILLSIGYSKNNRDIYDRLKELCAFLKDKDVNTAIVENDIGSMHYIKCILRDTQSDIDSFDQYRDLFYSYASNIIYNFISREYESEIVEKVLKENYDYLDICDMEEIKQRTVAIISGTGIFTTEGLVFSISCKNNILRKIEEFLQESVEIILDGFITFRLKDISNDIADILDRVVEEYILEKEYSEFVKLLKYFVDIQESKYEIINILINTTGDFIVEDDKFSNITKEFFQDFDIESFNGEVSPSDILISALITCAPKKIVVHGIENSKNQEVIDTVRSIFGEKLVICTGCDSCMQLTTKC